MKVFSVVILMIIALLSLFSSNDIADVTQPLTIIFGISVLSALLILLLGNQK
jgi:hypothetical protein